MPVFLVCHLDRELKEKARAVIGARIASLKATSHLQLNGAWILDADATADEIRDLLTEAVPEGDGLMVVAVGYQAAWKGITPVQSDWLVERL